MANTFTPPVRSQIPSDYIDDGSYGGDRYYPAEPLARRLWGRFHQPDRAVNVFKLVAGGYTELQPYEAIPGTVIAFTYLGSHTYTVSNAEKALLQAAGYTVT